jgi:hypothetical protein
MGGNNGRSKEEGANFRLRGDAIFRCTIYLRFPSWADWFEAASASTSIAMAMASYSPADRILALARDLEQQAKQYSKHSNSSKSGQLRPLSFQRLMYDAAWDGQ